MYCSSDIEWKLYFHLLYTSVPKNGYARLSNNPVKELIPFCGFPYYYINAFKKLHKFDTQMPKRYVRYIDATVMCQEKWSWTEN
ncbi:hypothetical protein EB796_011151 [Bugula neritina]|uniref:Uncharacterized protein n=1 Tax=Bugula neritina TaxID=10212 RepID=A0A7J7JX83_BUGNE|nr:hypothetical protein EB796_011151 [Bugula neritina]